MMQSHLQSALNLVPLLGQPQQKGPRSDWAVEPEPSRPAPFEGRLRYAQVTGYETLSLVLAPLSVSFHPQGWCSSIFFTNIKLLLRNQTDMKGFPRPPTHKFPVCTFTDVSFSMSVLRIHTSSHKYQLGEVNTEVQRNLAEIST